MRRTRVDIPDEKCLQLHRNTRPEPHSWDMPALDTLHLCRYPDVQKFQDKWARFLGVDPKDMLLTSGIDGACRTIFEFHSGARFRLPEEPTWAMYRVYAGAYGVRMGDDVTFLVNPAEPVERVLTRDQISKMRRRGRILVVDEAYHGWGAETCVGLEGVLVMRSFSKWWGMPGIRLGALIGDVAAYAERRPAYETNSLSLAVATWALDNRGYFDAYSAQVGESRALMKKQLAEWGFETSGSVSNTIMIKAPGMAARLKARGILTRQLGEWVSVGVGDPSTSWRFLEAFHALS